MNPFSIDINRPKVVSETCVYLKVLWFIITQYYGITEADSLREKVKQILTEKKMVLIEIKIGVLIMEQNYMFNMFSFFNYLEVLKISSHKELKLNIKKTDA